MHIDNTGKTTYTKLKEISIMQHLKYIPLFALVLTACGSNFSASSDKLGPQDAGTAGQDPSSAGNAGQDSGGSSGVGSNGGATNNSAGSSGKESGSAGSAGDLNAAGSGGAGSSGGMSAGGMTSAGSAGMNNTAGSAGMGVAGGGACTPTVTCASYSKAHGQSDYPGVFKKSCGLIDNGCGQTIDCGGCADSATCGGTNVESTPTNKSDNTFTTSTGDKNICNYGAGCVRVNTDISGTVTPASCHNLSTTPPIDSMYYQKWYCFNGAVPSDVPPQSKCKDTGLDFASSKIDDASISSEIWCCSL